MHGPAWLAKRFIKRAGLLCYSVPTNISIFEFVVRSWGNWSIVEVYIVSQLTLGCSPRRLSSWLLTPLKSSTDYHPLNFVASRGVPDLLLAFIALYLRPATPYNIHHGFIVLYEPYTRPTNTCHHISPLFRVRCTRNHQANQL